MSLHGSNGLSRVHHQKLTSQRTASSALEQTRSTLVERGTTVGLSDLLTSTICSSYPMSDLTIDSAASFVSHAKQKRTSSSRNGAVLKLVVVGFQDLPGWLQTPGLWQFQQHSIAPLLHAVNLSDPTAPPVSQIPPDSLNKTTTQTSA